MNGVILDWDQIVEVLAPRLYNYFIRKGFLNDSPDLTQEVFVRLHEKIINKKWDQAKGSIDQYSFGIARLVALENNFQSSIYLEDLSESELTNFFNQQDAFNVEEAIGQAQVYKIFIEEIKLLKPIEQEVLTLFLDSELKIEDISEILKLPVGTIKSHLYRAKDKLKNTILEKGLSI